MSPLCTSGMRLRTDASAAAATWAREEQRGSDGAEMAGDRAGIQDGGSPLYERAPQGPAPAQSSEEDSEAALCDKGLSRPFYLMANSF